MSLVKICGTTSLQDALLSVERGAGALGFIFAPSKRRVEPAEAAAMVRLLPRHVLCVGVFTEPDPVWIASVVREVGLHAVQMHWSYSEEHAAALRAALGADVSLWQVVGVPVDGLSSEAGADTLAQQIREVAGSPQVDVLLLDSVKNGQSGGLGQPFSWAMVAPMIQSVYGERDEGDAKKKPALAVAGGLSAENVANPIRALRPWAVDVVSGVETSPGRKSAARLEALMKAVQAAREEASPAVEAGNVD